MLDAPPHVYKARDPPAEGALDPRECKFRYNDREERIGRRSGKAL